MSYESPDDLSHVNVITDAPLMLSEHHLIAPAESSHSMLVIGQSSNELSKSSSNIVDEKISVLAWLRAVSVAVVYAEIAVAEVQSPMTMVRVNVSVIDKSLAA